MYSLKYEGQVDWSYEGKCKVMKTKLRISMAIVIASVMMVAGGTANAVVTLQEDGSWFVGKGDVQSAFGWDAKTTDANFEKVTFRYTKVEIETVDCITRDKGTVTLHGTVSATSETTRSTEYEIRKSGKRTTQVVTGAVVTRAGTPTTVGSAPDCSTVQGVVDSSSKVTVVTETLFAEIESTLKGKKNILIASIWEHNK